MVQKGTSTFGQSKHMSDDYVAWDLKEIYFILSKRTPHYVTVTLGSKQLERLANIAASTLPAIPRITKEKIHDGFYHFKGYRPDETRKVKLTEGVYSIRSRHEGRGNFVVWMFTEDDEKLVANEIGYCQSRYAFRVADSVVEVFFAVEHAGGPWEIDVKKVSPGP